MKNKISIGLILLLSLCTGVACTNLDEELFSSVPDTEYYRNTAEVNTALNAVYAQLRGLYHHENTWGYNVVSSDECVVPGRGGNWVDGGKWLQINAHTWDQYHPHLRGTYNRPMTGISRANTLIERSASLESSAELSRLQHEARFLRAFFYYEIMDMFGRAPLVTTAINPGNLPAAERSELYAFVVSELEAIKDALPATASYGRISSAAAYGLLAKLYLNEGVYNNDNFEVNAPSDEALNKVIAYADKVGTMGHSVYPDYLQTFSLAEEAANTDYLLVATHLAQADFGNHGNCWWMHYAAAEINGQAVSATHSKWNGFAVNTEFYNSYAEHDNRRAQLVTEFTDVDGIRWQHQPEMGVFDISDFQGVRVLKYNIDPAQAGISWGGDGGNDFAILRYADVLLMKAEAQIRLGKNTEGLATISAFRQQGGRFPAGDPYLNAETHQTDMGVSALDFVLAERGWEMLWEGTRRQDLIRHGKYLGKWSNKTDANNTAPIEVSYEKWNETNEVYEIVTENLYGPNAGQASDGKKRLVLPLPAAQISANPNLSQTEGY
ncbi:RagB/SusD family nutrient uptake outer membrane protein [Persicobacter diffluens]|uniref:Membrane protein n=1 Tax=Persicobacter diffluens TaxID=981 RepID=A0AAN4W3G2_9BACT|nr:membrane protein [Persicobacter diffluens]